jgi:gamma-glutamyl-gamma-aminobutyrate hydrolase PuuD
VVAGGGRLCLGVQWHPELLPDDPQELGLFTGFVRVCRDSRGSINRIGRVYTDLA